MRCLCASSTRHGSGTTRVSTFRLRLYEPGIRVLRDRRGGSGPNGPRDQRLKGDSVNVGEASLLWTVPGLLVVLETGTLRRTCLVRPVSRGCWSGAPATVRTKVGKRVSPRNRSRDERNHKQLLKTEEILRLFRRGHPNPLGSNLRPIRFHFYPILRSTGTEGGKDPLTGVRGLRDATGTSGCRYGPGTGPVVRGKILVRRGALVRTVSGRPTVPVGVTQPASARQSHV